MITLGFAESNEPTAATDGAEPVDAPPAHDLMTDYVPWGISILAHAGLVLLTSFIIWSAQGEAPAQRTATPTTKLGETPSAELESIQTQTRIKDQANDQAEQTQSRNPLDSPAETSDPFIGGAAASGSPSPFGSTSAQASGSDVQFMGQDVGGEARKLVFVIDASGSLIDTLPYVIGQLEKTIRELSGRQRFTVIFFRSPKLFPDQPLIEVPVPRKGLKQATPTTKKQVIDWMRLGETIVPGGSASPIAAIRKALGYKPDLLIMLSDDITGDGIWQVDQQALLEEIKRLNTANTRINTIQFLYRDPLAQVEGRQSTMKLIAEQTGGRYKFVDDAEVQR
jgi:hypothetical protein